MSDKPESTPHSSSDESGVNASELQNLLEMYSAWFDCGNNQFNRLIMESVPKLVSEVRRLRAAQPLSNTAESDTIKSAKTEDVWTAIFHDYRDLSKGLIQKESWNGGSNMTSTFEVIRKDKFDALKSQFVGMVGFSNDTKKNADYLRDELKKTEAERDSLKEKFKIPAQNEET